MWKSNFNQPQAPAEALLRKHGRGGGKPTRLEREQGCHRTRRRSDRGEALTHLDHECEIGLRAGVTGDFMGAIYPTPTL